MSKGLVIVESPAKAKTIQKYLGKGFTVEASLGHVKDLPKSILGVDTSNDFETDYVVIPGKEKVVARLKKLAASADAIYLAPDPDREGEAIAAHLADELDGNGKGKKAKKAKTKKGEPEPPPRIQRVTFNEITKRAVQAAFEHPRTIDQNLVDAQQARRVLDRLVGYQVSPLLWDKVRRGLSAGRVQTVALRLIVEREREIKAFEKKEYWTIDAHLAAAKPPAFDARFLGKGEAKIEIPNGEEAEKIRAALEKSDWVVRAVDKKERRRNAAAPFTTSKLQQDASRKLRFSVKRTMMIAQRLYEGVELGEEGSVGLITYMRTDSVRVAPEAIQEVREYVDKEYGAVYLPESPNAYKEKKEAQAAHEAIRPTSAMRHPDEIKQYLKEDEFKVYKLIWQRFVASQMNPAVFDQTTVDIDARTRDDVFWFRVTGSVLKFDGFLKIYEEAKEGKDEEDEELKHKLPALEAGQKLTLKQLKPEQHFTEPPPRYNEASLVKELEERGIGRPSTYSAILSTIQERQYVQKLGGKFVPTEIGLVVTDLLVENFRDIFDVQYTARLEEELDEIEEGKEKWTDALAEFYKKFQKDLKYAAKHMENIKRMEKPTDEKCELCGSPLVIKWGKHGSFYACSTYDKDDPNTCKFTKENPINLPDLDSADMQETTQEEYCENCGRVMVLKRGRFGQFMACTGYPDCKTTRRLDQGKRVPDIPLDELCPKCGRNMMIRHGRFGEFTSCSGYPECKYVKQNFIGVKCPECKEGDLVEKRARKGNTFYGCGNYPKCKFTSAYRPIAEKCPSCGSEYLVEKNLKTGPVIACPNKECNYERPAPPPEAAATTA
ncbi:DNA topoisomerase 1 [Candidatus Sulfotelmatobacter kueseliae]|uniref:DNA topoisomerase 1 n=1 Tax=Candidatus Sulfotelmatobacter kueseliae TaxID=2042962 RepID=A0A2U3KI49_9BACT|nr:DNA topoisomerase 1 [Candidatus Sulfotelmatobacter kueseliae]